MPSAWRVRVFRIDLVERQAWIRIVPVRLAASEDMSAGLDPRVVVQRAQRDHRQVRRVEPPDEKLRPAPPAEQLVPARGRPVDRQMFHPLDMQVRGPYQRVGRKGSTMGLATHGAVAVLGIAHGLLSRVADAAAKTAPPEPGRCRLVRHRSGAHPFRRTRSPTLSGPASILLKPRKVCSLLTRAEACGQQAAGGTRCATWTTSVRRKGAELTGPRCWPGPCLATGQGNGCAGAGVHNGDN